MRHSLLVGSVLIAFGSMVIGQAADVPTLLSHQGRLLDASNNPVTGMVDLTFRIFDVDNGGSELWSETHLDVQVTDGLFSVTLGSVTPLSADILTVGGGGGLALERYLEVQVGNDPPISPRTRLVLSRAGMTGRACLPTLAGCDLPLINGVRSRAGKSTRETGQEISRGAKT